MLWRRPEIAVDMVQQYKSDTDYSDDSGSEEDEEEEEDDISLCSGSTISAGGQSCTVTDLFSTAFDEAYSDGMLFAPPDITAQCENLPASPTTVPTLSSLCTIDMLLVMLHTSRADST